MNFILAWWIRYSEQRASYRDVNSFQVMKKFNIVCLFSRFQSDEYSATVMNDGIFLDFAFLEALPFALMCY